MAKKTRIVIADRNRNVRNFLQRELADEGYQVAAAADEEELLRLLGHGEASDLLILDPDIPSFFSQAELVALLHLHYPELPIVIHTFLSENHHLSKLEGVVACLEKGEDMNRLKKVIAEVTRNNPAKVSP